MIRLLVKETKYGKAIIVPKEMQFDTDDLVCNENTDTLLITTRTNFWKELEYPSFFATDDFTVN